MNNQNHHNEKELLARLASGDQQALAMVVAHYTRIIYAHLLSYIKDAQKAEEITQDIFVSIWKNRQKLPEIDNFAGYIYAITRNRAFSALKEKLADIETCSEDQLQHLLTHSASTVELKELAAVLAKGINALPARRKEVFLLSRTEQLTYEEIAAQLNISKSAVRQHIVEALVFLRNFLKKETGIIVSGITWLSLLGI